MFYVFLRTSYVIEDFFQMIDGENARFKIFQQNHEINYMTSQRRHKYIDFLIFYK